MISNSYLLSIYNSLIELFISECLAWKLGYLANWLFLAKLWEMG